MSTRNTQKITAALNNFYNFQLNTNYTNLTFVNIDRFNFWAFYTFLNNNPLDVNNTKINNIKNFVQSTDYETANSIVDYLFQNKDDVEAVDEITNIIDILDDGMINGEQVVVGPDIPITDMVDYLDCFDTSQPATITIYADQPKNGKHDLYTSNDGVGHAFISIKQGNKVASFGFYPQSSVGSILPNPVTLDPTDFMSTPGIFGNDQNHDYDVSLSVPISAAGLNNLINTVINVSDNNPNYNLGNANCTDIAILIFENQTPIDIPSAESPGPWKGQTPGTLGEVIRNMPTPTDGSKNTNGGSAPNNNCN